MGNTAVYLGAGALGLYLLYKHGQSTQAIQTGAGTGTSQPAALPAQPTTPIAVPGEVKSGVIQPKPVEVDYAPYVTSLFRRLLNRDPDPDGLKFWINNLKTGGTPQSVYQAFINSDEYKALHPSIESPANPASGGVEVPATPITIGPGTAIQRYPPMYEDTLPRKYWLEQDRYQVY